MESADGGSGGSKGERRENGHDLRRELLATANSEGRFTSLNASWERILGWSREELMARPLIEFVHPEDVERTIAQRGLAPERDRELVDFENRFRTKDGEYRWLSWHAYSDGERWLAAAADVTDRKLVHDDFEQAIAEDRLLAYRQQIIDWRAGEVVHEELLARLRGRQDGLIFEAHDFLPEAERTGAIGTIDRWMTMRGLELADGGRNVAINLSTRSIADHELMEELIEAVGNANGGAARLVFEITETAALENVGGAREVAERLGSLGCAIALDDFGTGFASLTHLRDLPVQIVKIDARFVAGVRSQPADRALVEGVASMARALGMRTVAEGVEDEATYELLKDCDIDWMQGYLVGRPSPV
jgi:PAS domain S-box-containing protein